MNPVAAAFALAFLAAIAAAGVAAGFLRREPVPLEPVGDPLEDRRLALLRSLADLEEAHTSGALEELEYARLRRDTEGRMAHLLRATERHRPAPAVAAAATETDVAAAEVPAPAGPRKVPAWAVAVLVGGTVLAMVVAALVRDTSSEDAVAQAPAGATSDPLAFFEQRAQDHPNDLAARLDLAHRYLDVGRFDEALAEYAVALEIDPGDAEAHAHVGIILYQAGRAEEALASVNRALETDPTYPEALFIRGVILLRGLNRPAEALDDFHAYLDAAPFGSERTTAEGLVTEAEDALAAQADTSGN